MKKIIFIGDYRFPSDYASCNRVYYMAKACQSIGYDTIVIGKGKLADNDKDINVYKGIKYTSMSKKHINMFIKLLTVFKRRRLYVKALREYAINAEYVIAYGCSCPSHMKKIIKFGRKNNVKIICDVSEWYDRQQFHGLKGMIEYVIFQNAFKNTFHKADKIICCSKLVKDYYIGKNNEILILNGIIDVTEFKPNLTLDKDKCVLIYSGIPSKKDYLIEFYKAFDKLQEPNMVELNIVGPTQNYLDKIFKQMGFQGHKPKNISIIPRVDKETLIKMIKESTFSVLLRPNKRYANAGFPSKLCESLSVGTPMMTNLTSDIGDYLSDDNSIIIKDVSVESVANAIRRAIEMDREVYNTFRTKAYDIARNNFSIETGAKKLEVFFDDK